MASGPVLPDRRATASAVLLASAGAMAVLATLLATVGGGSWGISRGASFDAAGVLGLAGAGAAAAGWRLAQPGGLGGLARRLPRLYPFADPRVSVGVAIVAVVSVASVVSGIFAEYAGALNGGDSAGLPNPVVGSALYLIATAIFWAFAIWLVALLAATVRLGRWMEQRAGWNAYGRVPDDEPIAPFPLGVPAGPAPARLAESLFVVILAVAVAAMAGIQTVEAGADPASPGAFLALQAFTPLWTAGLAVGLAAVDGHVRSLERRATEVDARPSEPDRGTAPAAGGPGFIHG